jgi:hypothetical protein
MFSSLLQSAKIRLFQTTDAYSNFEIIIIKYKTFRLSTEEKLQQRNELVLTALVSESVNSQHDDKNAVCYLI